MVPSNRIEACAHRASPTGSCWPASVAFGGTGLPAPSTPCGNPFRGWLSTEDPAYVCGTPDGKWIAPIARHRIPESQGSKGGVIAAIQPFYGHLEPGSNHWAAETHGDKSA